MFPVTFRYNCYLQMASNSQHSLQSIPTADLTASLAAALANTGPNATPDAHGLIVTADTLGLTFADPDTGATEDPAQPSTVLNLVQLLGEEPSTEPLTFADPQLLQAEGVPQDLGHQPIPDTQEERNVLTGEQILCTYLGFRKNKRNCYIHRNAQHRMVNASYLLAIIAAWRTNPTVGRWYVQPRIMQAATERLKSNPTPTKRNVTRQVSESTSVAGAAVPVCSVSSVCSTPY